LRPCRLVPSRSVSFRLARAAEIAIAIGTLGALADARATPQGAYNENTVGTTGTPSMGTYPQDACLTFNYARGGVRFANPVDNTDVIHIWTLPGTGIPIPTSPSKMYGGVRSGNRTLLAGLASKLYRPSDRIELTNLIGVSIGSGNAGYATNDETYIEYFTTSGASVITQFVISPGANPDFDRAGRTNDLEITRDGAVAVVNSDNWIHFVNLATSAIQSDNIGSRLVPPLPPSAIPCTPDGAVDSVAVTNDCAVVTTARLIQGVGYRTYVYLVDLTVWPPVIVLEDFLDIPNPPPGEPWASIGDRPHDVTIDPTGAVAVVTTTHHVASYDLANKTRLDLEFFEEDWRLYQEQVDSVEVTDKVAVVISDRYPVGSPGASRWHVQVFAISTTPGAGLTLVADYLPPAGGSPTQAHDLAIASDFDKGVIRTSVDNVVLTSLSSPPPLPTVLASPNGSDAYAYRAWIGMQYDIFSSDSVVISPRSPVATVPVMAATIGGYFDSVIQRWRGCVDLIDLSAIPLAVVQVDLPPDPGTAYAGCVPVDLAMSASQTELVVRCADPGFSGMSPQESDVVVVQWAVAPPSILTWYRGNGTVMGLDSLAAAATGLVSTVRCLQSISQDATSNGYGYVHVAR
jgi:hypothetical protein